MTYYFSHADLNQNQKSKTGFIEVVPKNMNRVFSAPLKTDHETAGSEKDLEGEPKFRERPVSRIKAHGIIQNDKEYLKDIETLESIQNEKQDSGPESEHDRKVSFRINNGDDGKLKHIGGNPKDIQLGFTETNDQNAYENDPITAEYKDSNTHDQNNENGSGQPYLPQGYNRTIRRSKSKEIKHSFTDKIVEEMEDHDEEVQNNAYVTKKTYLHPIEDQYEDEEDHYRNNNISNSRDSDRDPSITNASNLKYSRYSNALENNSFSANAWEGGMRFNAHEMSSRFSVRKDTSFDVRRDQILHDSTSHIYGRKDKKARSIIENSKLDMNSSSKNIKQKGSQRRYLYQDSSNQRSNTINPTNNMSITQDNVDKPSKILNNWHQDVSEDNMKNDDFRGLRKPHEIDRSQTKEMYESGYLKKFNLLDDLNNIYNHIDGNNPPLGS